MARQASWGDTLHFGKHQGRTISDLYIEDISYLHYLCKEKIVDFESDVYDEICTKYNEEKRFEQHRM